MLLTLQVTEHFVYYIECLCGHKNRVNHRYVSKL